MKKISIFLPLLLLVFVSACGNDSKQEARSFSILSINDVYRIEPMDEGRVGGFARFKSLRDQLTLDDPDLITLHAGDFLSPSVLGLRYKGEQMIDIMNQIDGDKDTFDQRFFVVPGNHEFDVTGDEGAAWFRQRVSESDFTWLSSNINWSQGSHPEIVTGLDQVLNYKIIEAGGVKVGIFGLTLNRDKTKYAPIENDCVAISRTMSKMLRDQGAEVVIALTHLFVEDDMEILEVLGEDGPDIIFGGHEHEAMNLNVNGRHVVKADSDLRSATVAHMTLENGQLSVVLENKIIDKSIDEDPELKASVDGWIRRYYKDECGAQTGETCQSISYGHTNVELDFDQGKLRSFETNLGNWLADVMLNSFEQSGKAQIAFINSGAIRRSENIAAGSDITNELIKELLPYDPKLYLIEITGRQLKEIISHSVEKWGGNGYWLQIAGFVFRQTDNEASDIMLMEGGNLRPISDDELISAVTVSYLLDKQGPQDGYTMLGQEQVKESHHNGLKLYDFISEYMLEKGTDGISPMVEGRICTNHRSQPCLLDTSQ